MKNVLREVALFRVPFDRARAEIGRGVPVERLDVWEQFLERPCELDPAAVDLQNLAVASDENHLRPVHLLCTHGHFDHNFGIDTIYDTYGLQVEVAREDEFLIADLPGQFHAMIGGTLKRRYPPVGRYFREDETIRFGSHQFKVLKTPGHSPGGVVFYCEEEHVAFTGDTIFKMSIGRTDFERGSYEELMNSLQTVIAKMPGETVLYCGHGPKTSVGEELRSNPYLR